MRWITRTIPHWDELLCPECQNSLDVQQDDVEDGEIVCCRNCGSQFEVMTSPFELRRVEDGGPTLPSTLERPAA
jgi:hypothetical protein